MREHRLAGPGLGQDGELDQGRPDAADRIFAERLTVTGMPATLVLRLAVLGARGQRARRAAAPRNRQVAAEVAERLAELARLIDGIDAVTPALMAYRFLLGVARGAKPTGARGRGAALDRVTVNQDLAGADVAFRRSSRRPG